jgi:parallel beta-helix repeat protein
MTRDDTEHGGSDAETGGNATRSKRGSAVLAVVVAVLAVAAVATAAPAAGAPTQINSCTTITQPGEYVLTADITDANADTCIDIRASDVVFDGRGHTVDGVHGVISVGVLSSSNANVTVADLLVTDWRRGIKFEDADRGRITGVTARSNGNGNSRFGGIALTFDSDNNTLSGTVVAGNNGSGVYLEEASDNTLTDTTARSNADEGMAFGDFSLRTTLTDNTVRDNGGAGIRAFSGTTGFGFVPALADSTLSNNTVTGNADDGIGLPYSGGNTLMDNAVRANGGDGVSLFAGAEFPGDATFGNGNTLSANRIVDNGAAGVRIDNSNDSTLSGNVVRGNDAAGIVLDGATDNRIVDNRLFNDENVVLDFDGNANAWNSSNQSGPNVVDGPFLGGNYYASPDGTGFSQTCTDADGDGFCDSPNTFGGEPNNTDSLPLVCAGSQSPGDVTGDGADATDPDCDGRYENVNGDEPFDVVDVQALFANRESAIVQNSPEAFNINGDTDDQDDPKVDVVDVQRLFVEERAT